MRDSEKEADTLIQRWLRSADRLLPGSRGRARSGQEEGGAVTGKLGGERMPPELEEPPA